MCNLETAGVKYGCGHYLKTQDLAKIDCGSSRCTKSQNHPTNSRNHNCEASQCRLYYGPDRKETIVKTVTDYCSQCNDYYRGRHTQSGSSSRIS
ncbi:hypothetical protein BDZ89DRAFT_1014649 [Hymenopellis radicata]|nr:hypothetical protein BDZ89DRAFT_1014649 [Hymenopellis radicata]